MTICCSNIIAEGIVWHSELNFMFYICSELIKMQLYFTKKYRITNYQM